MNGAHHEPVGMAVVEIGGKEVSFDPFDSTVPPLCEECVDEGIKVEPDGHCPHGNPSMLLILGVA